MNVPRKTRCGRCGGKVPLKPEFWDVWDGGAYQHLTCRHCDAPVLVVIGCAEFVADIRALFEADGVIADARSLSDTEPPKPH